MKSEALYKNFENIPTRKGRGGTYPYIRWQDVANRMNEVFGTNWSSEVLFQDVVGANVIVRVRVSIFNPENERVFAQEGFGGAPNDANNEAGNPFKSAYSKALKDACKKWGVGLYLDEDDETGGNTLTSPSPFPPGYTGKELGVPPSTTPKQDKRQESTSTPPSDLNYMTPTPPAPSAPPISSGGMPLPPGVGGSMPLPPGVSMGGSQSAPPTNSSKDNVPMSKVGTINTGEPEYISDVQRAALQSILNIKGAEYEPLAKEAFEFNGLSTDLIPEPDRLSYQEAVYVIKYGNDKFRRR